VVAVAGFWPRIFDSRIVGRFGPKIAAAILGRRSRQSRDWSPPMFEVFPPLASGVARGQGPRKNFEHRRFGPNTRKRAFGFEAPLKSGAGSKFGPVFALQKQVCNFLVTFDVRGFET